MGVATAAGFRDIGSSTMRYVPEIYSPKLLIKYYDASVMAAISNTNHEGEIKKFGDTVYIRTVPDITIRTYTRGMTLVPETPESTAVQLDIDNAKYWDFIDEEVDNAQTDIKDYIDRWTTDASEQLKISIETGMFADIPTQADSTNSGDTAGRKSGDIVLGAVSSPVALDKTNILEKLVDCGQALDENNVPETGRWVVLPAWACSLIKKSDLKDASLAGDATSIMRNGQVGMIDRFMVYRSNLLDIASETNTPTSMIFGHPSALTFATQLVKNENKPNPFGFGRMYMGLQVYGYKVALATGLGRLYGYKA